MGDIQFVTTISHLINGQIITILSNFRSQLFTTLYSIPVATVKYDSIQCHPSYLLATSDPVPVLPYSNVSQEDETLTA